jgi:hypothetical protein
MYMEVANRLDGEEFGTPRPTPSPRPVWRRWIGWTFDALT